MYPIINIGGLIEIPTYSLIISITYCIAIYWMSLRTVKYHLDTKIGLDLALVIMVAGFIGARLFHVFYELPEFYMSNPIEIFKFWNGGFVFFGGAFLAFFSSLIFLKLKREPWLIWADLLAPISAFGYGLGRIACFLNGCCFSEKCDLPWSIHQRHPTQLYATILEFIFMFLL